MFPSAMRLQRISPKTRRFSTCTAIRVIPGLVGMHDHMFYPVGGGMYGEMGYSFPRLYLAAGVTTIRTTGSLEPYTDLELKKQIDAGNVPGPHIHVTGPYLEGAGSWALQMHQLTGRDDATKTVNYWLDEGVGQFQSLHVHHAGRAFRRSHGRPQTWREDHRTPLHHRFSRSRCPGH